MLDHANHNIVKVLPPSSERKPLFVVGDVHGCAAELQDLIQKAKQKVKEFQLVLVGDLFTKGPDPVGIYDIINETKAICVKGNHDWALWASILQAHKHGTSRMPEYTQQTLHMIRHHKWAIFDLLNLLPHIVKTDIMPAVPKPSWEPQYPAIVVHAGIDPTRGILNTSERMLLTARYVRWEDTPEGRRLAVIPVGHRAEVMGKVTQLGDPRDPATEKFRWHALYEGPELIMFGHDAKQGLFRKTLPNGRPICVGLDTGCTYGQAMTGYFPEFDDAIQVPAKRKYFDSVRNSILIRPPRVAV